MEIKVPHLAEGITSGTIVNVFISPGDQVQKDQDVMEIETEKAVAALPSPAAGTISEVLVKPGDKVNVGQTVAVLSGGGEKEAVTSQDEKPSAGEVIRPEAARTNKTGQGLMNESPESVAGVPASPTVRRTAKELGIDLSHVRGSQRGGRITLEDLRAYIQRLQQMAAASSSSGQPAKTSVPVSIDFSKWGPVEKIPMTNLRKKISEKMIESWQSIPHVTQFEEADLTALLALRKKINGELETKGVKLTVTVLILKAIVHVLKRHAKFNASIDEAHEEIVLKKYYHIGVAVDTEQGLLVPVIRDVDKKSLEQLSKDLAELAEKARLRKVAIEDLRGGTFTISNQGGIGGAHFTPIINKPEVAILGLGQAVSKPVAVNNQVAVKMMIPLALSYDHRAADGADAARFIADLKKTIEGLKQEDLG
ncbi:MAG: 2-oxo acid dehydrogenase subunit E2 [Candidatus Omnitrophica bacterium]|nr:2-oxo acid dehydrogenase subunit E2 [Candidatus Omnitrophota bacterium]